MDSSTKEIPTAVKTYLRDASDTRTCKRPAGPLTKRQRRPGHVIKMEAKRFIRAARVPGFTAVASSRISNAIQARTILVNIARVESGQQPLSTLAAREQAIREVTRSLPRAAMVFDWRNGLPTRNDAAAYRKD